MEEILNACFDEQDERNYIYEEMDGEETPLPKKVLLETGFRQNQALDGYKSGCVYYARAEASNYLTKNRLLGKDFIKKSTTRVDKVGDYTLNGTKLLVKEGVIKGYAQVNTLEGVKRSLANGRPIHTGSNKLIWSTAKQSPFIAKVGSGSGHSIHIIGYDDTTSCLICKNSYGPEYMNKGNFYVRYEDFSAFHNTKLSLIENVTLIDNYKQKIMENIKLERAKKAFEEGIWNGLEGAKNASREEVARMIYRAIEKLSK